ncbi:MAG: spoIIE [Clostridia bacterium]|nr:spoIIE [Clostridia bacterium]
MKLKSKSEERILSQNKINIKKLIEYFFEASLGFIMANIVIGSMFAPFGIAFTTNSGIMGVIGVLLGYIVNGKDVLRYIIAATIAAAAKHFLSPVINVRPEIKSFLFSLWSVLCAGVAGIFLYDFTFRENLFFSLSGIISGIFAYIFSAAFDVFKDKPQVSSKMHYICFTITMAVFLLGILSFGGLWSNVAFILTFFVLFCIANRCSLLYTSTTATLLGLAYCIYDIKYLFLFGILILGSVLASLLKDFGKYTIIVSFLISNALITIYYNGEPAVFTMLFNILAAGITFFLQPDAAINNILRYIAPLKQEEKYKIRKKTPLKKFINSKSLSRLKDAEKNHAVSDVCGKCKQKLICWIKNYNYTTDIFNKLNASITKPDFKIPEHFSTICPRTTDLIRHFKMEAASEESFKLVFAKASKPKNGEAVCGDTCGIFPTCDNRHVLCIADGMGTGATAARQSAKSTKLIQQLLNSGIEKADALRLINETLLKNEYETVLGVDLAVIDMLTGQCEIFKAGAAPTFIVRHGNVFEIGTASLPIGMLEDTGFEYNRCTLLHNDIIVMISDGLISCGTKWLTELITNTVKQKTDCFELANRILNTANDMDIQLNDDITVITAKLIKER